MSHKSKSNRQNPKKEFIVSSTEAGVADILEAADRKAAFIEVSSEERHQLIAEAAYFRAEQRSFTPGYELEDWLEAEAEIEMRLSQMGMIDLPKNA